MNQLFNEIRHNPLLWLLVFVPIVLAGEALQPDAHTLLFVLSVLAIVPLAGLLSHATESVAAKTGTRVRSADNTRAVVPPRVMATIAAAFPRSASVTAASQTAC